MKAFLQELAETLFNEHRRSLDALTVVFPNRRAILYFRKHLAALLDRPAFSPRLLTIEDFIAGFSTFKVPEKLQLIHRLHKVYHQVHEGVVSEAFDQFYFWGDMLLRDFDEADRYLVETGHLFRDLSHQKEIDTSFDFLTDEQREFLRQFWMNFEDRVSPNQQKFLQVWRKLPQVYEQFRDSLIAEGLAYEGLLHRMVASNLPQLVERNKQLLSDNLVFAGFNALTKAEEVVLSFCVERGARVFWDVDDYYLNNQTQEAGRFFREYSRHATLGKTLPSDIPSHFKRDKQLHLYAAALPVGQAKVMAEVLEKQLLQGMVPEETLIVLPDEKLLTPVLYGVADKVEKLNVTMGLPLTSTPVYNLIELLVELQLSYKDKQFNHRPVVALLGHPYIVAADVPVAHAKRKEIVNKNRVHVEESYLASQVEIHRKTFVNAVPGTDHPVHAYLTDYLKSVIVEAGRLPQLSDFDKEYCYHFLQILNRMQEIFDDTIHNQNDSAPAFSAQLKSFMRLFRQVARAGKIPFAGEPLRGLQVMGVLETRNLDFKNVFILSLNEGAFPSSSGKGSYIPFNIRKAYGMPTVEHQDSIYAYLFYRVLQRAENIYLFYNSETDELGQGEMSRYLQQLLFESGLSFAKHVLHNELQPMGPGVLSVKKDASAFAALARYCDGPAFDRPLSPTALNDYIECRLKFYMRHLARIREPREVEEDLDARILGNFLHKVMEYFYLDIIERKGSYLIEEKDFEGYEKSVASLIDRAFIEHYDLNPDRRVNYEGQRLVVREIVNRFVNRIIEMDKLYAPFHIEALERRGMNVAVHLDKETVLIGGSIDRADRKDDVIRVIDYKTGKDLTSFTDIPGLFDREGKRNKAAFQTFVYTLVYHNNLPNTGTRFKLVPGLMNRKNLFNEDFRFGLQYGGDFLEDATPLLPGFEENLKQLLTEMFDPGVDFDQTTNPEVCQFCPYNRICCR